MLIGITGLHGAGKSYFCDTIPSEFGFKVFSKKKQLQNIYKLKTGRDDWKEWYRSEYQKDPRKITEFMLLWINDKEDFVIDAIHSPVEWGIIKEKFPNAQLAEIVTPKPIRKKRIDKLDMEKDTSRIAHWHDNGCLLSEVDWTFNGAASKEINEKSFKEFIEYIKELEKEKQKILER